MSRNTGQDHAVDDLTLIICTYNNAGLLGRTLATLEAQACTAGRWSLLVVDNNCTDRTAAVVERYLARGRIPGLRCVVERRQGLAFARRRGIAETESAWIAFVDDDCLLDTRWVHEAITFIREHPRAGAIGGRIDLRWEERPEPIIARFASSFAHQDYGEEPCPIAEGTRAVHLVGAGLLLSRDALRASGWLASPALTGRRGKGLAAGEDTEIVFRIRNAGYELWYNPAMRLEHFIKKGRMSVPYLCRLQRGFGQSRPITKSMRYNHAPTLRWRLHVFVDRCRQFARLLRSCVVDHWLAHKPLAPEQRIGFHFRLGELEGAWHFLLRGYRL